MVVPVQALRKKGLAAADKKAGRVAAEGLLAQYIHAGSRSTPNPLPPQPWSFCPSIVFGCPCRPCQALSCVTH